MLHPKTPEKPPDSSLCGQGLTELHAYVGDQHDPADFFPVAFGGIEDTPDPIDVGLPGWYWPFEVVHKLHFVEGLRGLHFGRVQSHTWVHNYSELVDWLQFGVLLAFLAGIILLIRIQLHYPSLD